MFSLEGGETRTKRGDFIVVEQEGMTITVYNYLLFSVYFHLLRFF